MKTLIVEIKDKSKNDFVKELLGSFSFITVKDKKDFKDGDKKLVKKFKKAFNEKTGDVKEVKHKMPLNEGINEVKE